MKGNILPVKRMVLYKHGVGYVERKGKVGKGKVGKEKELKLSFKKDMMNDLLKSLCVFSTGKGKVSDISYETPEDITKILEEKAIRVPEREAMIGLFRQLKGYAVAIETNTETIKGKVLGTQETRAAGSNQLNIRLEKGEEKNTVVIKDEDDCIRNIDIEKIIKYRILDPEAAEDLKFFLDTVTSERKKNMKAVTVFLDGKEMDLNISYIMQMPSWRVSYRLAHDKDKTFLQGWGIIDNVLDEDLADVTISLVAGKPISFIYDLYTPPEVYRPVIREESRGVGAPVELEAEMEPLAAAEFAAGVGGAMTAMDGLYDMEYKKDAALSRGRKAKAAPMRASMAQAPPPAPLSQSIQDSTRVQTKAVEMGEFFRYDIENPVTIKRGQSAMVPIIQANIECVKEHVYNGQKMPHNPLVTMRIRNDTGLVLERGPIVVLDESTYVGEAILPYTVPKAENHIPYSVDMGVIVTEEYKTKNKFKKISIKDDYLWREEYETMITKYTVENKNKDDIKLVLEHPKDPAYKLIDTPKPAEDTENFYRWKSSVKGKKQTKFKVKEGRTISYTENIRTMSPSAAEWYFKSKHIDKPTFEFIKMIIDLRAQIDKLERRSDELENERDVIFEEQERIRQNLESLSTQGTEEKLRNRYVGEFEKQENRIFAIKKEKQENEKKIKEIEKELDGLLKGDLKKRIKKMYK